nr:MAG: hypothetical protein Ga0209084_10007147 [Lavidaviridae sp.]
MDVPRPSAQLFAKALAAVEAKLSAAPSQVKLAKSRESLHQYLSSLHPPLKLSWPPPEEVYAYHSLSEAAQIVRINPEAQFEVNGKRVSEERMKEIKDRAYEMEKAEDRHAYEMGKRAAVEKAEEAWKWSYVPEAEAFESSLQHDLENGRSRKEYVENKREALLAKLKERCT